MPNMHVPFVDLGAQYLAHRQEFDDALRKVIDKTAFIGGEFAAEFEKAFASAIGAKHCIAVANGTDAIYIALRMLGIGPGDEVITSAASWISTSETIGQTGARPVFVDVDEYFNIDAAQIEPKITERTRAIIPVHLYGQAANLAAILPIAARHRLYVLEDCAQAHLARCSVLTGDGGGSVGTFGNVATFSFYPGKNLGAWGDAGGIVTDNDDLARLCRMYANHGALVKHHHQMEGINSRMDGLQASLLTSKLKHLHHWTEKRRQVARTYDEMLTSVPQVSTPKVRSGSTHVYHLYVIDCEDRDGLKAHLSANGVETAIHYPHALPFLGAYSDRGFVERDFPRAARNQGRILSLPIYAEMTQAMVAYVVAQIRDYYRVETRIS